MRSWLYNMVILAFLSGCVHVGPHAAESPTIPEESVVHQPEPPPEDTSSSTLTAANVLLALGSLGLLVTTIGVSTNFDGGSESLEVTAATAYSASVLTLGVAGILFAVANTDGADSHE